MRFHSLHFIGPHAEKLAIVIGSFSYGYVDQVTGSMHNSMVFMSVFFISGFIILQRAKLKRNMV
jgi:MFS transporter, UMF1 family